MSGCRYPTIMHIIVVSKNRLYKIHRYTLLDILLLFFILFKALIIA